jgi:hypothetical protein
MHRAVGSLFQFIGGALGRVAATGLVVGIFFVVVGVTPWQYVAELVTRPPGWSSSAWFRNAILILGLASIWASLNFNRWSNKQKIIDSLAEDISGAIDNLLNRKVGPAGLDADHIDMWERDFISWCSGVSGKLSDRAFFTRSDQLHFDYLGFVTPISFYQNPRMNNLLSQLRMKIERVRDVINWTQERGR